MATAAAEAAALAEQAAAEAPLSAAQVGCVVAFALIAALWVYAEVLHHCNTPAGRASSLDSELDPEGQKLLPIVAASNGDAGAAAATVAEPPSSRPQQQYSVTSAGFFRCLLLDPAALLACRPALRSGAELGAILLWFYLADRSPAVAAGPKSYSRDVFLFTFVALTAVAAGYTAKPASRPAALNRHQTEEWKGWMQVLFLLYHYYNAKEAYNAIRVFIAAYVWMTGYGNFSYYYKTGDFGLGRFSQMMWRLNFLVTLCCLALRNSYMLYYICPMHTLFTIMVYAALAIGSQHNKSPRFMWAKLAACVAVVFLCWDVRPVFYAIWSPLAPLMGYTDPRRPGADRLHEWFFRSSLDRYIWIHGMLCAYLHPRFNAGLAALDELRPAARRAARAALCAVALGVMGAWYWRVYRLPKLEYNRLHPYTSWIPITAFIVLRNLTPELRTYSLRLYGWLGCITLETYIGQFHTWLLGKMPDGQPIHLLVLLPGYPLLNFSAVTALYVFISHRLFHITCDLRDAIVPHDDNNLLGRNALALAGGAGAALAVGTLAAAVALVS